MIAIPAGQWRLTGELQSAMRATLLRPPDHSTRMLETIRFGCAHATQHNGWRFHFIGRSSKPDLGLI